MKTRFPCHVIILHNLTKLPLYLHLLIFFSVTYYYRFLNDRNKEPKVSATGRKPQRLLYLDKYRPRGFESVSRWNRANIGVTFFHFMSNQCVISQYLTKLIFNLIALIIVFINLWFRKKLRIKKNIIDYYFLIFFLSVVLFIKQLQILT